jgi:phospholipid transport system substrate-binding protein
VLCLALPAMADEALEKPVKTLVSAVRYGKDDLALKSLDGDAQGAVLLGDEWGKATAKQREEFASLFHQLFAAIAFPKIRSNFEHLETTLYEPAKVDGDKAELTSTIVILHPLKKQEIKVKYDMHKLKEGWKVVDVTVLGTASPSMLSSIKSDQVQPLFKDGGWDKLLQLMRDRLAQLKAAK